MSNDSITVLQGGSAAEALLDQIVSCAMPPVCADIRAGRELIDAELDARDALLPFIAASGLPGRQAERLARALGELVAERATAAIASSHQPVLLASMLTLAPKAAMRQADLPGIAAACAGKDFVQAMEVAAELLAARDLSRDLEVIERAAAAIAFSAVEGAQ